MPKVGDKEFAYPPEGEALAEEYAMETEQDVIPTYDAGGRVERMQGYEKGGKVTSKDVAKSTMAKKEFKYRMKKVVEQDTKDLGKPKKHKSSGKFKRSAPKN